MWILVNCAEVRKQYVLFSNENLEVGRFKDKSHIFVPDEATSRHHGFFRVEHSAANLADPSRVPVITFTDHSSQGTFVNDVRIEKNKPHQLADGDMLSFGSLRKFRLERRPLIVCMSTMQQKEKEELSKDLTFLGGHLVNEWCASCTHICMPSIKITVKAMLALLRPVPFVTLQYIVELGRCAREKICPFPDPAAYVPPISVNELIDPYSNFAPTTARNTLFKHLKFFCFTEKQVQRIKLLVQGAGGAVQVVTKSGKELMADECVVINPGPSDMALLSRPESDLLRRASQTLKKGGKRLVPESDISYAILYISVDEYCNPNYMNVSQLHRSTNIVSANNTQASVVTDSLCTPPPPKRTVATACLEDVGASILPRKVARQESPAPQLPVETQVMFVSGERFEKSCVIKHEELEQMTAAEIDDVGMPVTSCSDLRAVEETPFVEPTHHRTPVQQILPVVKVEHSPVPAKRVKVDTSAENSFYFDQEDKTTTRNVVYRDNLIRRDLDHVRFVSVSTVNGSALPNYKKFRKASGQKQSGLPRIIGGRLLEFYAPHEDPTAPVQKKMSSFVVEERHDIEDADGYGF